MPREVCGDAPDHAHSLRWPSMRVALVVLVALSVIGCRRAPLRPEMPPRDLGADAVPSPPDTRSVAVAAPDARPPAPPKPRGTLLTVLYSANLLGEYEPHPLGGLARRASFAEATRQSSDGLVQVDAGDTLLPAPVRIGGKDPDPREVERRARLVATGLGRLHLDAITPGETDLALGLGRLRRTAHGLPMVASNVTDRAGRPLFAADRLVTAAGVRAGIFGLVGATAADAARWEKDGVRIGALEETARKEVEGLRKRGAAVVVGLFHLPEGPGAARRIGAAAGVDVVILGHDAHAEVVGGAPAAATP